MCDVIELSRSTLKDSNTIIDLLFSKVIYRFIADAFQQITSEFVYPILGPMIVAQLQCNLLVYRLRPSFVSKRDWSRRMLRTSHLMVCGQVGCGLADDKLNCDQVGGKVWIL